MQSKEKKQVLILIVLLGLLGCSIFIMKWRLEKQQRQLRSVQSTVVSPPYVPNGNALSSGTGSISKGFSSLEETQGSESSGASDFSQSSGSSISNFYAHRQKLKLQIDSTLFSGAVTPAESSVSNVIAPSLSTLVQQELNTIVYEGYFSSQGKKYFLIQYQSMSYTFQDSGVLTININGQNDPVELTLQSDNSLKIKDSLCEIVITKTM